MDFNPSIEQDMLRDSVRQFVGAELSFETRHQRLASKGESKVWTQFAELGWLAMAIPEDLDGLGSSVADLAILCEELGRGLVHEPIANCSVFPARILALAERSAVSSDALTGLASGERRLAVALHEPNKRFDVFGPAVEARRTEAGDWCINGVKLLVQGGAAADTLIVSARMSDNHGDEPAFGLLLVDVNQPGVARQPYRTLDDIAVADFTFSDAVVPFDHVLAFPSGPENALEFAIDEAIVCLCADIVGAMSGAIDMTAEYLRLREQFGRPLAEFQALQHSMAEMFIDLSDARSMLYQAIGALSASPEERRRGISGCKIKVMEVAKKVTGMAVHLHGGIGVTTEYPVGHYLRRVMVAERLFGDNEHHMQRYLEATGVAAETNHGETAQSLAA